MKIIEKILKQNNMKRTFILFALFFFLFSENISAQFTFQKVYKDSISNSFGVHCLQTSQGKYLVTSYKDNYKRTDTIINCDPCDTNLFDTCYSAVYDDNIFCLMINEYGDTIWTRQYGDTTYNEYGKLAIENNAGYLLLCNRGYYETTLIQIDTLGQELWEKSYHIAGQMVYYESPVNAQPTNDGYIITGDVIRSNYKQDMFLFKIDINGDSLWVKYFGDSLRNESSSVVKITSDFGFVVAGYTSTDNNGNYPDIQLFKTDSSGNLLWYKIIGDTAIQTANYLDITSDGGFILIGNIANRPSLNRDIYLVKTDPNGDTLWTKRYGLPNSDEYGRCIKQTLDKGYIITGSYPALGTIPLIKTDSTGVIEWTQAYNYNIYNLYGGFYVAQTSDSGYIITGGFQLIANYFKSNIFLIKTDVLGKLTSLKEEVPQTNIKLYPNPFHTTFTLEVSAHLNYGEIIIYDMLGNEMLRKYFTGNKIELERRNLRSGIYLLKVSDKERHSVQKIVVE
jgi:hypothetical protein